MYSHWSTARLLVTVALAAILALIESAAAQNWPTRPVTMVVTLPLVHRMMS
jgi:tripartite-type tricarboxylate transporter receptor subunit TctC